ncbi:hypothetical protein HYV88_03500 [Candidatus Woesearchaeota archaeon]|nr:hypothetical protein [Candidatus Woesearchaeota archaeon]
MVKIKLFVFLAIILVGYIVITSYDLNLKEKQDQKQFFSVFSKWFYKAIKNTISTIGFTLKQDWSPINKTGEKNDTKTAN